MVQERLGHHSAAFTLDVYSAVIPALQRDAVERLSDLIVGGQLTAAPSHQPRNKESPATAGDSFVGLGRLELPTS
jgi:hypothetical protein